MPEQIDLPLPKLTTPTVTVPVGEWIGAEIDKDRVGPLWILTIGFRSKEDYDAALAATVPYKGI